MKPYNIQHCHSEKKGNLHHEKKGDIATSLATQFLNCKRHLQLIIFICHEC